MNYEHPQNIPNHGGELVNHAFKFFGEPPADIGTLLSAQSNLLNTKKGASTATRLTRAFVVLLICFIIAGIIGLSMSYPLIKDLALTDTLFYYIIIKKSLIPMGIIVGMIGSIIALLTFFGGRHSCTYVGDKGLYEVKYGQTTGKLFTFDNADAILTGRTEQYYNGVYTGTLYRYSWITTAKKKVHLITGQFRQKQGFPQKLNDPFYYADMANISWNQYKYKQLLGKLQQGEVLSFNAGATVVNMGLETFSIIHKGKQLDWDVSDIEDVQVIQGFVTIFNSKHTEMGFFAKMFGQGKISFAYASMPNVQIFLMLMDILMGKTKPGNPQ